MKRWTRDPVRRPGLRFPTVSELYQAISTGPTLRVPDPNLKPERARSAELAVERRLGERAASACRCSTRRSRTRSSPSRRRFPGSTTLFNFVQNIDQSAPMAPSWWSRSATCCPRFDLSGSFTLADPKIVSDPAFPAAEGKLIPQVPRRRARSSPPGARRPPLADRCRALLQPLVRNDRQQRRRRAHLPGFEGYFVADARAVRQLRPSWSVAAGIENLTDKRYFLFHPFPAAPSRRSCTGRCDAPGSGTARDDC